MGGRNISTTKSGKFMNPTDQARKEARKRELKKNKKQRLLVRQNVLKGKNPRGLISEMEHLDRMEYDPVNPSPYNIKVLQEKRKKVKETWDQVYRLYKKDQPESATQMDTMLSEYERNRSQLITWFESVKETQRVTIDEIPMPELPSQSSGAESSVGQLDAPRGILKREQTEHVSRFIIKRKPPGPPPGRPPILSDNEDVSDDDEEQQKPTTTPTTERRRIRFADPSSGTVAVSRWSDRVPNQFEQNEKVDFGTAIASAQPVLYNTQERPVVMPPSFPPPARPPTRLPPPPPPPAFFAANPSVRMPPNVRAPPPPFPPPPGAPPGRLIRPGAPNVFSAPPSINKVVQQNPAASTNAVPGSAAAVAAAGTTTKPSMTFEAKPQIRARQEVTKFVPTVLKVKRTGTSAAPGARHGEQYSSHSGTMFEDPLSMRARPFSSTSMSNPHGTKNNQSTDDAYETFMKEINHLV